MKSKYLFTSQRLGFRKWSLGDLDDFAKMNADPAVMEFFPSALSREETEGFISRLIAHYDKYGHCYFATEVKETEDLIGFIGLAYQTYESHFTPAVDIGWRLKKSAWSLGYATEGAQRCLEHAFDDLGLTSVFSTCTISNARSENIMKKIGMTRIEVFNHPRLKDFPDYRECILYQMGQEDISGPKYRTIENNMFLKNE